MKTAQDWLLLYANGEMQAIEVGKRPPGLTLEFIRTIQADALREAAEIALRQTEYHKDSDAFQTGVAWCKDAILTRADAIEKEGE